MDINEKMDKLFEDEAFANKMKAVASDREIEALLQEKGLSKEEIREVRDALVAFNQPESDGNGELDEEALEAVSGGCIFWWPIPFPIPRFPWPRWPKYPKWPGGGGGGHGF